MTMLDSMIYAGLSADDPRVMAAMEFIRKNIASSTPEWDMRANSILPHLSKSLKVAGLRFLMMIPGSHDWKMELGEQLIQMQQEDGSWVNQRMTDDRQLVTAYAPGISSMQINSIVDLRLLRRRQCDTSNRSNMKQLLRAAVITSLSACILAQVHSEEAGPKDKQQSQWITSILNWAVKIRSSHRRMDS